MLCASLQPGVQELKATLDVRKAQVKAKAVTGKRKRKQERPDQLLLEGC